MKKYLLLLVSLVLALALTGCNNAQQQANDYIKQADKYRNNGKLDDAIALYNKALNVKESSKTRDKLRATKLEKDTVDKVKSALKTFKDVDTNYLQGNSSYITPTTITEATDKLHPAVDELDGLDDSQNTDISAFVKKIKEGGEYKMVKDYLKSGITQDGSAMEGLGLVDGGFQTLNEIGSSTFKIVGNSIQSIADTEIPSKYQGE